MNVRRLLPPVPSGRDDVRLVGRTARLVLSLPAYALVALLTTLAALTAFAVAQNLTLVTDVVVGGSLPVGTRLSVLLELFPVVGALYSPAQSVVVVAVAALVGVDVAMVVYHLREHGVSARSGGGSLAGVVLGTLGAGCAACGTAVLAGLLSLVGVGGATLLLPFEGLELGVLAALSLLLSMFWLADGMRGGEINGCPID
ncbi:hypothetical protein SAMN04487947_2408 [Halogeometricum rufum]|uniref:Uncharacterized protein n=1 Tax=Halogeometricum rufum TaxID=553469 RepID=A0A1I6HS62_9EURY|nr:hypothetical protein [Halogeometricum rufum]SFR57296.1 hypothetical protein SAMN04487947_2408 [Halogeometricum rufum]